MKVRAKEFMTAVQFKDHKSAEEIALMFPQYDFTTKLGKSKELIAKLGDERIIKLSDWALDKNGEMIIVSNETFNDKYERYVPRRKKIEAIDGGGDA